jgi:putative hydrolase of the HAD superfamily
MDDTLYEERKFVYGGFRSVAKKISEKYPVNCDILFSDMIGSLNNQGRGKIFDDVLKKNGIYHPDLVDEMVTIYRNYLPSIQVYPDVFSTFDTLREKNIIVGIITDGLHSVQKNKVCALNLQQHTDFIYYTDELGEGFSKPNSAAFEKVLQTFQLRGNQAIYIGNDPSKDFIGANAVGMFTSHICRQGSMNECKCDASYHIKSLTEIVVIIHYIESGDQNAQRGN